ncbi:MAG: histidine--tRNA ligase [Oscillospiraceae bacterium]|nr:histidine--tRNA ligase [Oscillospiraceae bacterium]
MAVKYTKPKGVQDLLPTDSYKWLYVEEKLRKIVGLFGYKEIRLPTFEHTEVFARGVGDTTDIVSKEMYTFLDKGNRSITLRPEGTSGVVRAVLENGLLGSAPMPLKAYYLQSCFRYEKAQKGRLREFHQLGIECFGTNAPESDAEVIATAAAILKEMGVKSVKLEINSIGCKSCRPKFYAALKEYFDQYKAQLCETCLTRMEKNPMRILDCKEQRCHEIAQGAPNILDYICEDCKAHFERVQACLAAMDISFTINPTIVRGLDYYSNTVFEFIHTGVGTQGTVCGGGRYNGLVEEFEGVPTPAVGFGMGVERLLMAMEDEGAVIPAAQTPVLYVASLGEKGKTQAVRLVNMLRGKGLYAEYDVVGRGLKPQMKYANKIGAKYTLVLGDNEVDTLTANLKRMEDGMETEIKLDETLADALV